MSEDDFWIQAGQPRWQGPADPADDTLDGAIETIFVRNTEDLILVWHHIYVPLSYKYDVATMLMDILNMLITLQAEDKGSCSVEWPSNTFAARWDLSWEGDRLGVAADWRNVVGDTEGLLRACPSLTLEKSHFVREWKLVLERVAAALQGAGYSSERIPALDQLVRVAASIDQRGILYRA
jgi:hypothetical protein